jgi:hypothetical protein
MPEQFDTTFRYITTLNAATAASTLSSHRYQTNAYVVDASVASTAMPGWTELGTLYARFRTLDIGYKFNIANMEGFPVHVIHGFSNVVIASGSLTMQYAGNPLFRSTILATASGQSRACVQRRAAVTTIAGTSQALYDDLYTGSTTSNTLASAGTCHAYLGLSAGTNTFTALGVVVQVEITLRVRLSRPTFILT